MAKACLGWGMGPRPMLAVVAVKSEIGGMPAGPLRGIGLVWRCGVAASARGCVVL